MRPIRAADIARLEHALYLIIKKKSVINSHIQNNKKVTSINSTILIYLTTVILNRYDALF
jgi:hypothetical protein